MELENKELIMIYGGAVGGISATMLNAVARSITVMYSLGRALGSAVRYVFGKRYC